MVEMLVRLWLSDKDEVRGSNPRAPTRKAFRNNELRKAFFACEIEKTGGATPVLPEPKVGKFSKTALRRLFLQEHFGWCYRWCYRNFAN